MPDIKPSLSINNITANEGASGSMSFTFTMSLSSSSTQTVTVGYSTADGTAIQGSDYQSASGTLTFAPGVTSQTITVSVNGDTTIESNETFFVNLASPSNATIADGQGLATIVDDDTPLPSLSISSVSQNEGDRGQTKFTFTVSLSAASTQTVYVQYSTQDGSALASSDYKAASGTLCFSPGVTSRTITITVYTDRTYEANESFFLNLSSPTNAGLGVAQGIGTILNDDVAAASRAAANAAISRRELQLM